jgi:hypothetical protein
MERKGDPLKEKKDMTLKFFIIGRGKPFYTSTLLIKSSYSQ